MFHNPALLCGSLFSVPKVVCIAKFYCSRIGDIYCMQMYQFCKVDLKGIIYGVSIFFVDGGGSGGTQ